MTAKTCLLTGSEGFVGKAMLKHLVAGGYRCTRVDKRLAEPYGDLVDFLYAPPGVQYDLVVHLAYEVGGRAGIDGNRDALAANLRLDAELFRWAVETEQPHVLYFSSSAAYPIGLQRPGDPPLRESDVDRLSNLVGRAVVVAPDADYGWAKLTGERLASNARARGVNVSVVRPMSGYGTTQSSDYPLPAFVERAKRREDPFKIWGSGAQRRDFIHVDDVCRGALAVVAQDHHDLYAGEPWGGAVNLCTGVGTSMYELATQVCEAAGYEPRFEVDTFAPLGVMNRVGDPTKMLGYYAPRVPLSVGIASALAGVGN